MSLVHHENAEKHIISGDSGNEPEDSNRQEDGTKKHSKCFSHSDLLLVSRRYAYGSVTKRWQAKRRLEFIRNGDAPELSKIDNMRLFRFAYLLLLCQAAAAEQNPIRLMHLSARRRQIIESRSRSPTTRPKFHTSSCSTSTGSKSIRRSPTANSPTSVQVIAPRFFMAATRKKGSRKRRRRNWRTPASSKKRS